MLRRTDRTPTLLPQARQTRQPKSGLAGPQNAASPQPLTPTQRPKQAKQPSQPQCAEQSEQARASSLSSQALILYNATAEPDNTQLSQPLSKKDVNKMSIELVKKELSCAVYANENHRSILDYLEAETDTSKRVAAAKNILNELAETSEQAAVYTAFIWRYIELQKLWDDGHKDKSLHSADAFLDSLDHSEYVKRNITLGRSTQETNAGHFKTITRAWGRGWYNEFRKKGLFQTSRNLSMRVLEHMATAC